MKTAQLTEEKLQRQPAGTVSVREVLAYMSQDRYMTLAEAAEYLRLSARTIRRSINEIRPRPFRVGNKLLFKKSDLDRWMEVHRLEDLPRKMDEAMEIAEKMLAQEGGA